MAKTGSINRRIIELLSRKGLPTHYRNRGNFTIRRFVMKKLALMLVLCFVFAAAGWAQGKKEYTATVDAFCDAKTCKDIDGKPITGLVKWYYKSGKIEQETPYTNGNIDGIVKLYYENGKIKVEIPFKKSNLEGLAKLYDESGKLQSEMPYKDGKKEGLYKGYSENGAILEIQYKNNSAVSGVCISSTGKKTSLTNHEITYWNKGEKILCQ
jgi:hypothetical protein